MSRTGKNLLFILRDTYKFRDTTASGLYTRRPYWKRYRGENLTAENRCSPTYGLFFEVELNNCLKPCSHFSNTCLLYRSAMILEMFFFLNIIYIPEIYVPFHVQRQLILSDSNKTYLVDIFSSNHRQPPSTISRKSTFSS
jgi:hypothetical protein